jgi:hypothetical protein
MCASKLSRSYSNWAFKCSSANTPNTDCTRSDAVPIADYVGKPNEAQFPKVRPPTYSRTAVKLMSGCQRAAKSFSVAAEFWID